PCLAVFGAAGVAAVVAPTFEAMLAARFAMGFGAAGLVNLAITLIGDTYTGERRTFWIGKNAGVLTAGLAVFPSSPGS
ncbi:MAG: MFS transporter, partial [Acidimicrobiia bacterium]